MDENTPMQNYVDLQTKAQSKGWELLHSIASDLELGMSEAQASELAEAKLKSFGVNQIWHPTVIKFEEATSVPGVRHKPSSSRLLANIAYIDLGVVIDGMEVDCGKSFGFSQASSDLAEASEKICKQMISEILSSSLVSPSAAYQQYLNIVEGTKYSSAGGTAGHRLGPYPTKKKETKISPKDVSECFQPGAWMFEAHLTDGSWGAFHEELFFVSET